MRLDGSCQCGKVKFHVDSETPYPFMICHCSICRKTSGAVTVNIMGKRASLEVTGKRHLRSYHAVIRKDGARAVRSKAERWFCGECGSHLYLLDDRWPEGVWPNAAAIDTELPVPPEHVRIMTRYRPAWVPTVSDGPHYPEYPKLSISDWHAKHGLIVKGATPKRASRQKRRERTSSRK